MVSILFIGRKFLLTFKSSCTDNIEVLTASSVNSGNSFRQSRNVWKFIASISSWRGMSSGSRLSSTVGFRKWGGAFARFFFFKWLWWFEFTRDSRGYRATVFGNRSAAFSRNKKRTWVSLSRIWNEEDNMPTELPRRRAALAKLRSYGCWDREKNELIKVQQRQLFQCRPTSLSRLMTRLKYKESELDIVMDELLPLTVQTCWKLLRQPSEDDHPRWLILSFRVEWKSMQ